MKIPSTKYITTITDPKGNKINHWEKIVDARHLYSLELSFGGGYTIEVKEEEITRS